MGVRSGRVPVGLILLINSCAADVEVHNAYTDRLARLQALTVIVSDCATAMARREALCRHRDRARATRKSESLVGSREARRRRVGRGRWFTIMPCELPDHVR